jgi:hypothetical protein
MAKSSMVASTIPKALFIKEKKMLPTSVYVIFFTEYFLQNEGI